MRYLIAVVIGLMLAGCSDAFAWNNDQDAGQINGYKATEYGVSNEYTPDNHIMKQGGEGVTDGQMVTN